MCGFVTFFSNRLLNKNDKSFLNMMTESIEHRGPDDYSTFIDEHIFLGFRRLSIIDLENGKQPFSYEDGNYTLVFNGEIYNYLDLRCNLIKQGFKFSTNSEAEVILALYKHEGKNFIKKLRGMFSFVIWDKQNKKIIGARDPFGIKPFYYAENEKGIYCASELKSIFSDHTLDHNLDLESLHSYFTFQFVPEPNTIFKNIKLLKPGHIIEKELNNNAIITSYWQVNFNSIPMKKNNRLEQIRNVIKDSVSKHMLSDVELGTFLSGGVDSTIVTYLASRINPNIKSFTVGFDIDGYSELDLAKKSADYFGIENIQKIITPEEFVKELPNITWYMDGPVADPAAIPLYFIAREARKHVKVVLSGEGADELFGGYNIYHEPDSLKLFSYMPNSIKTVLKQAVSIIPEGIKGKSFVQRGCTPIEERYVGNAKIFEDNDKKDFLNYPNNYKYTSVTKQFYNDSINYDPITRMQYLDINTWLRGDILVKSDRMTMANSLELRVPFLDKEVFKIASALTKEDKLNDTTTKYLLREAFKNDMPYEFLNRKKLGYPVPIRLWLKNELYDWAVSLIQRSDTDRYIKKEYVFKMLQAHRIGPIDYSRKIWTILTFMLWHKVFIESSTYLQDNVI